MDTLNVHRNKSRITNKNSVWAQDHFKLISHITHYSIITVIIETDKQIFKIHLWFEKSIRRTCPYSTSKYSHLCLLVVIAVIVGRSC